MAIVLGSSTITGIGTDGFSSGSIGSGSLAANAVTGAKLGYAGAVVQVQYVNSTTRVQVSQSSTFAEPSSNYRVSITPLFSNSMMVIEYHVPIGYANGGWAANYVTIVNAKRFSGGGYTTVNNVSSGGTANGGRPAIAGYATRPNNGFDYNDSQDFSFTAIDFPATTSAIQYGFYCSAEGGNLCFGYSGSDGGSWMWDSSITIVVKEIKQ
jgi:hypothetical protein